MGSIRTFLLVSIVASITLVNFISALQGYRASMKEAETLLNQRMTQQMTLLSLYLNELDLRQHAHIRPLKLGSVLDNQGEGAMAFQIWDEQQRLLFHSANAPQKIIAGGEIGFGSVNFNGLRWHTLTRFDQNKSVWIVLAERDDQRYRMAEKVIVESILPTVLAIPAIGLLVWLIISLGLRPIVDLTRRLKEKEVSDLSPIQLENVPAELNKLAVSANELLSRLNASFEREKRFAADAAHELRTPLAALNIHLENLLAELGSAAPSAEQLKSCVVRMSHLIEQILLLNRTTPDKFTSQLVCVDLEAAIKKVVADCYSHISDKSQVFSFEGQGIEIYGDPFSLETLIQNLLLNAVKYTPVGGEIVISLDMDNRGVLLRVVDNGPGIPQELVDRVFERFYRVDGDRHNSSVLGCGLGLSIVRQIAELHGASIELGTPEKDLAFSSGLCVTVIFPQALVCRVDGGVVHA